MTNPPTAAMWRIVLTDIAIFTAGLLVGIPMAPNGHMEPFWMHLDKRPGHNSERDTLQPPLLPPASIFRETITDNLGRKFAITRFPDGMARVVHAGGSLLASYDALPQILPLVC